MKRPIIIKWSQEFSVGVPHLDDDHKELLQFINLIYANSTAMNSDDVDDLLSSMIAFSIKHFHNEESYMRRIGYRHLTEHKTLHDEFMEKIQQFHNEFRKSGGRAIGSEVSKFLASWWKDHILFEDQRYAPPAGPAPR